MRFAWLTFLTATLCGSLGAVTLQLSGDQDPSCTAGFTCIVGGTFGFNIDSAGGGFFRIVNSPDTATITNLNFNIPYQNADCPNNVNLVTLIIDPSFTNQFAADSFSSSVSSVCRTDTATLTGIADYQLSLTFSPGIGPNVAFDVNLNDDINSMDTAGAGGWLINGTSTNSTNSAPEPGTLAIACSGLLIVAFVRKRRYLTSFWNSASRASVFRSDSRDTSFRE